MLFGRITVVNSNLRLNLNSNAFIKELTNLQFNNCFNPYTDLCDKYDYFDAASRRRSILRRLLAAAGTMEIDSIWLGRDLGYRGGRRTGLPFTDDGHFLTHMERFNVTGKRPTKGALLPERSATTIWRPLSQISLPVVLWNVFPLHPHSCGEPFSNRAHNALERDAGLALMDELIRWLRPKRIVAIGGDAGKAALRLTSADRVVQVRHPSYGGQNIFLSQVAELYGLS